MIRLAAGCKLNLGLEIKGLRTDGCHELETFFLPLPWPADELRIKPRSRPGLRIVCAHAAIDESDNLLVAAWRAFSGATGIQNSCELELVKRIPVGAGLGGGSSDCARFLKWLNEASGAPLSELELAALAATLGADAPFFLLGTPCRARGKGEALEPAAWPETGDIVLVWPGIHVSTAWAFAAWDRENNLTKGGRAARNASPAQRAALRNDLEGPVFKKWPALRALKQELMCLGARDAAMSGSGSAIYGLFADSARAAAACARLRRRWPNAYHIKFPGTGM